MASQSDIVVVGAGIVGCAVAYELARRGASVEIIDDRPAGMGATQAAAGVLAPFIEARAGGPLLELTARSLGLFDAFIERVTTDSGCAVQYQRTGTLDVAVHSDSMRALAATRDVLAARHVAAELLDAAEVRAREPNLSTEALGGLLIPTHGFVGATELTRALATAARRHGAQLIEQGRVRRISRSQGEIRIETDRGPLSGGAVVIAAGCWAGQINIDGARARVPVRPIRGQILHLRWSGPPIARVVWGERCYIVPWQDRTVLVGATEEDAGFDERTTVAGVRDLLDAACELLPQTWTASMTTVKVGLRPDTPDHVPIIGRSEALPNLIYAIGHFRNGILLAPLTAELVANALLDNHYDPMLELTQPQRFGEF